MQQKNAGDEFRWGIWGTGAIASAFAADIAAIDGMRVSAVCSRTLEAAEAFGNRIGADKTFNAVGTFLADPDIDAVYVATPSAMHVAQTLQVIAAGKPCLTEKPLALDAAGAARLAAASEISRTFVMEAMWSRFLPAIQAAKRHIETGTIGKVTRIEADLSYLRAYDRQSRFFDPELGGGAAFDLGVYPVSLALFFMGAPERSQGRCKRADNGVDLRTEIELFWPDAEARLSCGFDRDGDNRMLITGTKGALLLHGPFLKAQRLSIYSAGALKSPFGPGKGSGLIGKIINRLPLPGRKIESHAFSGNGLRFQALAVRDAVRNGAISSPVMPLADSTAVAGILHRIVSRD
ncbi:putative dehydrogenase [Ochrobactrum sp. 19YEA23]|uniref:Gfo/Idh/MocA family protein n=1 Tax=Ochrobactrum sp. 19YEA23 TaxID=3039854 RepID=UPI00247A5984|nr:putative dehydrogenase [Ochrobactrum sp. 19YEA23]